MNGMGCDGGEAGLEARGLEARYVARNYASLPLTLVRGKGVHVWDIEGRRYLDMMSAYSAASFGHAHPRLVRALSNQARRLSIVSRAYHTDRLGPLAERLCALTGAERMLPMNTGVEAVETALKAVRKWAYQVKRVPRGRATIVACNGNFHGRTIAAVSMSAEAQYRDGFEPLTPGFIRIPFGDAKALEDAITDDTAAFIVEPIQGEAGIVVPPPGYLRACAALCRKRNVLLICDEVQTGLGRTGRVLASSHDEVMPDGIILGKALGGGLLPVSAFLARAEIMDVFLPGDHGSTFGGNPLACAVASEALDVLEEEKLVEKSAKLGGYLLERLKALRSPIVREVRGKGLFVGVELDPSIASARDVCELMLRHGILTKDTHSTVLRFAPPLTIRRSELDDAVERIGLALDEVTQRPPAITHGQ
jgi:ornithine--oxo-acid transaminase